MYQKITLTICLTLTIILSTNCAQYKVSPGIEDRLYFYQGSYSIQESFSLDGETPLPKAPFVTTETTTPPNHTLSNKKKLPKKFKSKSIAGERCKKITLKKYAKTL